LSTIARQAKQGQKIREKKKKKTSRARDVSSRRHADKITCNRETREHEKEGAEISEPKKWGIGGEFVRVSLRKSHKYCGA